MSRKQRIVKFNWLNAVSIVLTKLEVGYTPARSVPLFGLRCHPPPPPPHTHPNQGSAYGFVFLPGFGLLIPCAELNYLLKVKRGVSYFLVTLYTMQTFFAMKSGFCLAVNPFLSKIQDSILHFLSLRWNQFYRMFCYELF